MKLKIFLSIVVLAAIVGVVVVIKGKQLSGGPAFRFPPMVVSTATAETQEWEVVATAVGSLRADKGVLISAEIPGAISKIEFESGAEVEEGDLLIEMDASVEKAQLRSAKATADLAQISLKRSEDLRSKDTISQSELDAARAQAIQSTAQMENIQAAIDKKAIRAPFAGRLGIRQVNLGQVLSSGAPIVTLHSLDPIQVDFNLPQQQLDLVEVGYSVRVKTDARPNQAFEGVVTAINPQLDTKTRSVGIQATFENPDELLRPGMFAEVSVVQPQIKTVVIVPSTAIFYQSFGDTIFVTKQTENGLIAEQRFVRVGEARGDYVAIETGLEAGEEVVSMGVFKLSNGRSIAVNNSQLPEMSINPDVQDS